MVGPFLPTSLPPVSILSHALHAPHYYYYYYYYPLTSAHKHAVKSQGYTHTYIHIHMYSSLPTFDVDPIPRAPLPLLSLYHCLLTGRWLGFGKGEEREGEVDESRLVSLHGLLEDWKE
jgi:hypothetical protein